MGRMRLSAPGICIQTSSLLTLTLPLLYEVVAARQIMKQALLGAVPVVIVIHEEEPDPYSMMKVCVRRNEYVTRLSN
jgi:hypothetical protein